MYDKIGSLYGTNGRVETMESCQRFETLRSGWQDAMIPVWKMEMGHRNWVQRCVSVHHDRIMRAWERRERQRNVHERDGHYVINA